MRAPFRPENPPSGRDPAAARAAAPYPRPPHDRRRTKPLPAPATVQAAARPCSDAAGGRSAGIVRLVHETRALRAPARLRPPASPPCSPAGAASASRRLRPKPRSRRSCRSPCPAWAPSRSRHDRRRHPPASTEAAGFSGQHLGSHSLKRGAPTIRISRGEPSANSKHLARH